MPVIKSITDFIRSTFHEPSDFIPLHDPRFVGNEKKYLNECIDSNFVSSVGEFVGRFEKMCADYTGAKYAIAAMNGTAALHIALQLSGVERDDEVITQSLTFIATANAISYTGAHPVFLDVDRETMGLSPSAVEAWLKENVEMREVVQSSSRSVVKSSGREVVQSSGREVVQSSDREVVQSSDREVVQSSSRLVVQSLGREVVQSSGREVVQSSDREVVQSSDRALVPVNKHTKRRIAACVPMHTFGHPVKIDELLEVLNKYNIPMVEDSAESIGSYYKGKHTGTFGKFGILSFNGNKIITTGGGGMILTDDEELAKMAKHLTTQAKVPHAWEYVHDHIGYNYRLTNLNAAMGCAQMESLDYLLGLKRTLAEKYNEYFKDTEFGFFSEPEHCKSNYWLNVIITKDKAEQTEVLEYTNKNGVMTRPIWELMNRLPMFAHCQTDSLENAIWFADRVVNIPSSAIIAGYRKS